MELRLVEKKSTNLRTKKLSCLIAIIRIIKENTMFMQKLCAITEEKKIKNQHRIVPSTEKKPLLIEEILECPNCSSLFRAWYHSTVSKVTCPKCWAEVPI